MRKKLLFIALVFFQISPVVSFAATSASSFTGDQSDSVSGQLLQSDDPKLMPVMPLYKSRPAADISEPPLSIFLSSWLAQIGILAGVGAAGGGLCFVVGNMARRRIGRVTKAV
jgi:hypothetical protein